MVEYITFNIIITKNVDSLPFCQILHTMIVVMNTRITRTEPDIQEYLWNRGRITFFLLVAVVLLVIMLSVYVWQYIRLVEIQMKIKTVVTDIDKSRQKLLNLQLRKASLSRLDRIDIAARERLGMHMPERDDVIYLAEEFQPEELYEGHGNDQ
jgi:cell division protein FtsL